MALSSEQLWLIVAAKDDSVARSLTGALRMDGDRAILIDTVAMLEEYAATTALCVVVLSRDGTPPDLLTSFGHSNTSSYDYQLPPNYPLGVAYSVHVPGLCDKTATVRWFETDKDSMICRQDGLLMERDNLQYIDLTRFAVNEDKPGSYFGTAYSVQATMQFIRSDKTTCMGLATFEQPGDDLRNVSFYVCGDGHWQVDLLFPSGAFHKQLGIGMLAQPQTIYTMRVTIRDATMSMQINDVQITTLPNPGFITTSTVALANTEFGNSTFVSQILFSDFSVQPGTPVN